MSRTCFHRSASMHSNRGLYWTMLIFLTSACASGGSDRDDEGTTDTGAGDTDTYLGWVEHPVEQHSGFVTVEKRNVFFGAANAATPYATPTAKMFYTFIPADERPADKPLFVFLNGGPGAATTAGLLINGTGPYRMDPGLSGQVIENASSFTRLGNLLYIDPRLAGFSYDVSESGMDASAPIKLFDPKYSDIFVDASDILMVLLHILSEEWIPPSEKVVLIGESYGAARVTMMLDLLLNPGQLTNPQSEFRDAALSEMMERHYRRTLPGKVFSEITPRDARAQFAHLVLIQPFNILVNDLTLCSTCDGLTADDPRVSYCRAEQSCAGNLRDKSEAYAGEQAGEALTDPAIFERVFGVRPEDVPGLPAADRAGAYRATCWKQNDGLTDRLGALSPADYYYATLILENNVDNDQTAQRCDLRFRKALGRVPTFITDAFWDNTVSASKIPASLLFDNTVVSAVPDRTPQVGIARPGWMRISFNPSFASANDFDAADVSVRMPEYLDSGHMVAFYQGLDLMQDISEFLAD